MFWLNFIAIINLVTKKKEKFTAAWYWIRNM